MQDIRDTTASLVLQALLARRLNGDTTPPTDPEWSALAHLVCVQKAATADIMLMMGLQSLEELNGFRKGFVAGQRVAVMAHSN